MVVLWSPHYRVCFWWRSNPAPFISAHDLYIQALIHPTTVFSPQPTLWLNDLVTSYWKVLSINHIIWRINGSQYRTLFGLVDNFNETGFALTNSVLQTLITYVHVMLYYNAVHSKWFFPCSLVVDIFNAAVFSDAAEVFTLGLCSD